MRAAKVVSLVSAVSGVVGERFHLCLTNHRCGGGLSDHVLVPSSYIVPIPANVPLDTAGKYFSDRDAA